MADILKVTTPLVDRVPTHAVRPAADPALPFDLSNVTQVIKPQDPSEILQQNTGFKPQESDTPKILADLLKDPAVTATMIRNISILQEVIGLLPAANEALTKEIEQLFTALMVRPENIAAELRLQDENTTLFKGDLFDTLRSLLANATTPGAEKPEVATGIGVLLKGLNATLSRRDVLTSIANNLSFLADKLDASPRLFEKLSELVRDFKAPDAAGRFTELKGQVLEVLRDIENSVLFTPQMEKILPVVVYNLSRFNDNDDFLPAALRLLLGTLNGEQAKNELVQKLQTWLDRVLPQNGQPGQDAALAAGQDAALGTLLDAALAAGQPAAQAPAQPPTVADLLTALLTGGRSVAQAAREARGVNEDSQVIETLARIIGKEAESDEVQLVSGDRFEKIVHSLLSSPSNFTPLLHFIVPVEYMNLRAFAEIWVDPNAGQDASAAGGGPSDNTHMLMVFDVDGIGRFESELYVQKKRIALNLLCPPGYVDQFKEVGPVIRKAVGALGYSFESINIDRLERTHSLMEVFTDLPHRRTGIDVKV